MHVICICICTHTHTHTHTHTLDIKSAVNDFFFVLDWGAIKSTSAEFGTTTRVSQSVSLAS
jgi:hypothetical protein